jgi:hypothetical protein
MPHRLVKKRKPVRGFLVALPLIVAYFLLFPHPLGREVVLRARWRVALPAEDAPVAGRARTVAASGAAPFQLDDLYGFVTPDGALASLERTPFRVALSRRGAIAFARVGGTWVLDGPTGQALATFSGDGYPLLDPGGDRLFLVKTDLTGLRELGEGGEPAWTRDFPSMLTSLAIAGDWMVAGTLDGSVALVDRQGAVAFTDAPAGSRIPATFGVAVTADGERFAAVTGVGPQLLQIWRRSRDGYGVSARMPLGTDFRREVRMAFAPDGRSLACEALDGILIVAVATGGRRLVPLRGRVTGMVPLAAARGRSSAWVTVARDGGDAMLVAALPDGSVIAREPLGSRGGSPDSPWLGTSGDTVIVAFAGSLVGLGLEAR